MVSRSATLAQAPEVLLTMLAAPAGYGKTTLMSQWATVLQNSGAPSCWITCDRDARDAAEFAQQLHYGITGAAIAPHETALAELIANALTGRESFTVFIDDVHVLAKSGADLLMRVVSLAPAGARFVFATRSVAGLSLARLRAHGALAELGAAQLALGDAECAAMVKAAQRLPEDTAQLLESAHGWPVGVRLGLDALTRTNDPRAAHAIADFFEEEVFAEVSAADRVFLLSVSILDELCPALCDAVTEDTDSRARLRRLEQTGFFLELSNTADAKYRLHPMFAAFLKEKLQAGHDQKLAALHQRASMWLARDGQLIAALEHVAQARDPSKVADFLEANSEEMTYQGALPWVARHAEALPKELLNTLPKTLLMMAWLHTRQLRFDETQRVLDQAARRIDEMEREHEAPDATIAMLRLMLKHRQTVLATAKDDEMADVDAQSEDLLRELGDSRPYLTCTLYGQMLTARYTQYRLDDFTRIESSARSALSRSGYRFAAIGLQAALGIGLFHSGRTQAARESLEQALAEANRISGGRSGQAALAALPLARILFEVDERAEADQLVRDHLPVAREFGFSEQLHSGYITLNRLHQAEGDVEAALRVLDEGKRVALECNLDRLSISASAERIRIWIRNGRPDLALREGRREHLDVDIDAVSPNARSNQRDEIRAIAWTRLAASRDRMNEALTVTKRWRHFCMSRGALRTLVRWCIIAAQIHGARGDVAAAKRMLHEALSNAVAGRFIRSFLDEGPFIQRLIAEGYCGQIETNGPIEQFAREIFARSPDASNMASSTPPPPEEDDPGVAGAINAREVEILRLVGRGMRNGEIGARLGLTEGTVKWYMQQIYDKIGVRRRPQAVERARQLGMLH
ncbi:transcriptional activator of maltose regulon, MalT [alpha proteobacterium U9-1i]|nr:transcriptional activator of maltose regulon, MalT [alpha proteobacterium U9-1i]